MKIRIRFDKKQLKKFSGIAPFKKAMRKEMQASIKEAAQAGQRNMQEAIKGDKVRPGPSRFTKQIKKTNITLFETGALVKGIRVRVRSWQFAEVGFAEGSKHFRRARLLELGGQIPVTQSMRGMFSALAAASKDPKYVAKLQGRARELWAAKQGGWAPLSPSTTSIVVRPRPFLKFAFKTFRARSEAKQILMKGYDRGWATMLRGQ